MIRPHQIRKFARQGKMWTLRILRGDVTRGHCPICERKTYFVKTGSWLRDQLLCHRCRSIPRFRATIVVLNDVAPRWRGLRIHESSPGGPSSDKIAHECRNYVPTQFWPDVPLGEGGPNGTRCENLEKQTFRDESFDLVISQDVFEHVLDPSAAFREIARTLVPGGMHIFTVPWYWPKHTVVRAVPEAGTGRNLLPPDYHINPIDERGSLVVTEWGHELPAFILQNSGMTTVVLRVLDPKQGIDGQFREVFVSIKHPAVDANSPLQDVSNL